jgi:hypothetical protein
METIVVGYITAKTIKAEIIRAADGYRYDWFDATFKASGWTTRQQALAEDGVTTGLYTLDVDAATWTAGSYHVVLTDTLIVNSPLRLKTIDVVAGRWSEGGASLARAVLVTDITALDENSLAGTRLATTLLNLRRFVAFFSGAKVTAPANGNGDIKIYKNDGVAVLATIPITNDGTTQTLGPAA